MPLKEVLRKNDADLVEQVLTFNPSKVRKIADLTDKEVQVTLTPASNDRNKADKVQAVKSRDAGDRATKTKFDEVTDRQTDLME